MSEEVKITTENKCLCQSKSFRKFLITALGTFVGVFCALSLFAALHKPPMIIHPYGMSRPCPCHMEHFIKHKHFEKMKNNGYEKNIPIKVQKVDD